MFSRGTPPPKPLNCKSVSIRLGAHNRFVWAHPTGGTPRHSCASIRLALSDIIKTSLVIVHRSLPFIAALSPSVSRDKKSCFRCGKQGEREILFSFFRTCLHPDYPNYLRAVAQSVRGIASGQTHNPGPAGYDVSLSRPTGSANSRRIC